MLSVVARKMENSAPLGLKLKLECVEAQQQRGTGQKRCWFVARALGPF